MTTPDIVSTGPAETQFPENSGTAFATLLEAARETFHVSQAFLLVLGPEGDLHWETGGRDQAETEAIQLLAKAVLARKETVWIDNLSLYLSRAEGALLPMATGIGFFAAAPFDKEKEATGLFILADAKPAAAPAASAALLSHFAALALQELALRRSTEQREENSKGINLRLRTLVDNSIELMSILELDGKNSYLNKAGMEMLGFDNLQQVRETPISQLHLPEDIAFVEANVLPSVLTKGKWSGQMNVRHLKTGEIFPVFNNTVRIDDPETGSPLAIGAVMRDMRAELAAQQDLIISEDEMRNALEAAGMGYWNVDPATMTLRCNERTKELFGLPPEEAVDLQLAIDAIVEKDRARVMGEIQRVLQYESGGDYDIEYTVVSHRDRRPRIIRAKGKTYFNEHQVASQFSGTVQDVTDRRQQEQKLRLMLESIPQMAWTTQADGRVDYYNQGWYRYTGQGPEQALGEGWTAVMHPEDVSRMYEAWYHSVNTGKEFEWEARYRRHDGSFRWHLTRGVPIRNEEGNILFWTGSCTDVHDQRAAADELEQKIRERTRELQEANDLLERSNLELEQFAHVSSHDLQEPLRKIRMFTEMVRERASASLDGLSQTYLTKVSEAALRMSNSLRALLEYTQLQREDAWESIDLNETFKGIFEDLEVTILQKRARMEVDALPTIHGQKHQIQQLFYNLVNNALKFSSEQRKPEVRISAEALTGPIPEGLSPERAYVVISVQDNGIGFDARFSEKIFTLFQRLHDRSRYPGTGIGLTLCRKVAQKHGGAIRAESVEGEGAIFRVILPLPSPKPE